MTNDVNAIIETVQKIKRIELSIPLWTEPQLIQDFWVTLKSRCLAQGRSIIIERLPSKNGLTLEYSITNDE